MVTSLPDRPTSSNESTENTNVFAGDSAAAAQTHKAATDVVTKPGLNLMAVHAETFAG